MRYPNQQLRSVALEVGFAGRFSALSRLEAVQVENEKQSMITPGFRSFLANYLTDEPTTADPKGGVEP